MIPVSFSAPDPPKEGVMLDIGCGDHKHPDAIGFDIRPTNDVDIVGSATDLPFKDESIEYVYSSHVIEHFGHQETGEILQEWTRILRPGGTIELRCPWLRARALLYVLSPSEENIKNIYGGQKYPYDFHKAGFNFGRLREHLQEYGIERVSMIIDGFYGIPFIPSDLHVVGHKPVIK